MMELFRLRKYGKKLTSKKKFWGILASVVGAVVCGYALITQVFTPSSFQSFSELDMKTVGHALMGMEKYQYILPFEVISVLLLACIIGGIMIARKR